MKVKSVAACVLFSIAVCICGQARSQVVLVSCRRQSMARVLINCNEDWDTQVQTSDTLGIVNHVLLAGLSGIALTSQQSDLEVTDSTLAASGTAAVSSEYTGECFPPSQGWERHMCIVEYKVIFSVLNDAAFNYSCDLTYANGGNKFLLNEYPQGDILVNLYGDNVGSGGGGTLTAGKTYQLYVQAGVNYCWGCPHYAEATFDFDFTVVAEGSEIDTEASSWSAVKKLHR